MKNHYYIGGIFALDLMASIFIIPLLANSGPSAPPSCVWKDNSTTAICHGGSSWAWGNKEYNFMTDGSITVATNLAIPLLSFHPPNGTLTVNLISYSEGSGTSSFQGYQYIRWTFQRGEAVLVVSFGKGVSATLYEWGSVPTELLGQLQQVKAAMV